MMPNCRRGPPQRQPIKSGSQSFQIGNYVILGNDVPENEYRPTFTSLCIKTGSEARRIFDALSEGGEIETPLSDVAWSSAFGSCTDRFGAPWLLLALDR
jgi:PhnB protein